MDMRYWAAMITQGKQETNDTQTAEFAQGYQGTLMESTKVIAQVSQVAQDKLIKVTECRKGDSSDCSKKS